MSVRWFKMPTGTGENTDLSIIAKKSGISKPVIISCFTIFCELQADGKNRDEAVELAAFMLDEAEETVASAWDAMAARGIFPDPEEMAMTAAERKRKQRERDKSQDGHDEDQDVSQDGVTMSRKRERPDQRDQKERPDQTRVTGHAAGSGSFSGMGVVGSVGSGFDVTPYLRDADWSEMLVIAPGWDRNELVRKYNAFVANDPPRKPAAAFNGWLKRFVNGVGARA